MMHHFPYLTEIDTFITNDDIKSYSEATYLKKTLFYNMKIKTNER